MFSYTGNHLECTKIQSDKSLYHESKMAAKMAASSGKMARSLLLSNLEQQNLVLGLCFHIWGINWSVQTYNRITCSTLNQRWLPKWSSQAVK